MVDNEFNKDHLKENLKDGNVWLRLLFMLLFSVIYSVAEVVLAMVVVFQFLCVLVTGSRNDKVLSLGSQLSTFVYQMLRYLTYNSDVRPYPFSDWPSDAALAEQQAASKRTSRGAATKKKAEPTSGEAKSKEKKAASAD